MDMLQTTLCYLEKDGAYLMLHRVKKKNDVNHDKWIGVGGKLEPGETGPEALSRECREELGVTVAVGPLYAHLTHTYPDLTVELLLYQAAIASGTPQLLEHAALRWVAVDELEQYAFCPADAPSLERLRAEGLPPEFRPAS